MRIHYIRGHRGFTLVEILIVMALTGIVTAAIFGVYQTTQRNASHQEEVVDLQQNLRVAMDRIATDIRMAGFMVPGGGTPITSAPNSSIDNDNDNDCTDPGEACFSLQTASVLGRIARLAVGTSVTSSTTADFTLPSEAAVDLFADTDLVRIIRPQTANEVVSPSTVFTISSHDRAAKRITLTFPTPLTVDFQTGDLVVRVSSGSTYPETVTYVLNRNEIWRIINGGGAGQEQQVTAAQRSGGTLISGITQMNFAYFLVGNSTPVANVPTNLGNIQAVRVTLTGTAVYQGVTKTRVLESTIPLENRSFM